ncbi:phosphoribosyl transferase [Candidatus Parcubacteria bacterium]|nr:phosphoribosyl transferase [Candidatus Parcubacteria bacterium]
MFKDRIEAGKQLAANLKHYQKEDPVVLALPRGGVIPGKVVAEELEAPLGLMLVRKITHPFHPEYAIGAVVDREKAIYNQAHAAFVSPKWLEKSEASARKLMEYRRELYYGTDYLPPDTEGKTIIIVDDGIATGLTMKAAVLAMREKHPEQIVVAAPVASSESVAALEAIADEVAVLYDPAHFKGAVGAHYLIFNQVGDEEVRKIVLEEAREFRNMAMR